MSAPKAIRTKATTSAEMRDPDTAANRFYSVVELRARVLALLGQAELKTFMLVEKRGKGEVAKYLYHTVDYQMIKGPMSAKSSPLAKYLPSVSTILAHNITLALAEQRKVGIEDDIKALKGTGSKARHIEYLRKYQKRIHGDYIVPLLRRLAPNARVIHFGEELGKVILATGEERFTVYCDPDGAGRMDRFYAVEYTVQSKPPTSLPPGTPPDGYTIREKFTFRLKYEHTDEGTPPRHEEWLKALRYTPCFARLYQTVNLRDLKVTLDDIRDLCERNVDPNRPQEELHHIYANVYDWGPSDLQSFASVASSLTTLKLGNDHRPYKSGKVSLTFSDLPSIITIIRNQLRHLRVLHLAVDDVMTAEAVSLGFLTEDSLNTEGSLVDLAIYTDRDNRMGYGENYFGLFNVTRVLSCLFARDPLARLRIASWFSFGIGHRESRETQALKFFWNIPTRSRSFMSTADFSNLGVYTLKHLEDLEYDEDGRPISRWSTQSAGWAAKAKAETDTAATTFMPALQAGLADYTTRSNRLRDIMSTAEEGDKLAEAQELLKTIRSMKRAAAQATTMLEASPDEEIQEYIRSFEKKKEGAAAQVQDIEEGSDAGSV